MKINNYETFVNEGRGKFGPSKLGKVDNKVELRKGDCVVITKDIVDPKKDIDFSRTAKSWWGRNIYSLKNEFKSDFIWKKGNIVMLSVGDDKGYVGGGLDNSWYMSPYKLRIDRKNEEYRREIIDILIDQDMAEIVNYDNLPNDIREEFEYSIKDDRIRDSKKLLVSGETIGIEKGWYRVIKYNWLNRNRDNGSELKVVVNKRPIDFTLTTDEVMDGEFANGHSRIRIDGDPFNTNFQ